MTTSTWKPIAQYEWLTGMTAGCATAKQAAQHFAETFFDTPRTLATCKPHPKTACACIFTLVDGRRTYSAFYDPAAKSWIIDTKPETQEKE